MKHLPPLVCYRKLFLMQYVCVSVCIPSLILPAYQQMEKKKQENKMRRDQLNDEYLELLEKQRLYFKTVKEFKEVRKHFCYVNCQVFSDPFWLDLCINICTRFPDTMLISPCLSCILVVFSMWLLDSQSDSGNSFTARLAPLHVTGRGYQASVYLGFQVESLEGLWTVRYWSKEGSGNVCE